MFFCWYIIWNNASNSMFYFVRHKFFWRFLHAMNYRITHTEWTIEELRLVKNISWRQLLDAKLQRTHFMKRRRHNQSTAKMKDLCNTSILRRYQFYVSFFTGAVFTCLNIMSKLWNKIVLVLTVTMLWSTEDLWT